jgi:putative transposase
MARKGAPTNDSKPKRRNTPSFIVELPLRTHKQDEQWLNDRLLCGARLSNVMLQDGLGIVEAMRSDLAWQAAKGIKDLDLRKDAYQALRIKHAFYSSHFDKLVAKHARAAGFYGRIGTHEMQAIAKRIFKSLNKWVVGKGGRPRFKGRVRPLHSLEGKNNKGMLQWRLDEQVVQVEKGWRIPAIVPDLKKNEWLADALQAETKYCRIVWRKLNGVKRWYLQLVQQGLVPLKAKLLEKLAPEDAEGALDLGPSSLAWCTGAEAGLEKLCPEIDRPEQEIRILQRQIDRQRRLANPENFRADGTVRKGRKSWAVSNSQRKAEVKLANLQRKEAATRKRSHGEVINFLLTKARCWKDDGVSLKSLQRNYGKSVGKRAPGMLMSELKRKAERAGGKRSIIDIRNLKTSQYDHTTDRFTKKKLSERWHWFGDGRGKAQRDVYSAFLALHSEGSTHNPVMLERAWQALEPALCAAGLCEVKDAREGYADPRQDFACRQSVSSVIPEQYGLSVA